MELVVTASKASPCNSVVMAVFVLVSLWTMID